MVLDAYVPAGNGRAGQIVSRKFSQFSGDRAVQEATAFRYIDELVNKYPSDTTIASTPSVPTGLRGQPIEGELFLEVPVQDGPIPQAILDHAASKEVTIRDVTGRVYP